MMLVLVLGTVVTFSSCSKDDEENGTTTSNTSNGTTTSNTLDINGKKYTVDAGYIISEAGKTSILVGNTSNKIGFEIKNVNGVGESVSCSQIEIEDDNDVYNGKAYNVNICFTKNGNNYTVRFNNVQFTDNGKNYTCSLNYTGPLQQN